METMITMTGIAVTDVKSSDVRGASVASFRLLSTVRRYDRNRGWIDADTNFVTITCWRGLAQNVASSVVKGNPLLVFGKLKVRPWDRADRVGSTVEVEALAVGHDLSRGTSAYKPNKGAAAADREETPEETAARLRSSVEEEGLEAERAVLEARRASVLDAERVLVDGSAAIRPAGPNGGGVNGSRRDGAPSRTEPHAAAQAEDRVPNGVPSSGPDGAAASAAMAASDAGRAAGTEPSEPGSRREGKRTVFGLAKQRDQEGASV